MNINFKKIEWFRVIEIIVIVLTLMISVYSYFVAKQANSLATEQRTIEEYKFFFDQVRWSWEKSSQIYDQTIWSQGIMNTVFIKIKEKRRIENEGNLTRFLNSFEELGQLYCDGMIRDRHIRTQFWKTLDDVCENTQVMEYKSRNWLSILCKKFAPNRWDWAPNNENSCKNLDKALISRRNILEKYWIPFD